MSKEGLQERTVDDDIDKMNKEALNNFQWDRVKNTLKDVPVYGEYYFPAISEEKRQGMEEALKEIHIMVTPTVKNLRHTSNVAELQERIYRKFYNYEMEFNTCVFASKNVRDTNYCADKFISQLRGEGRDYVAKILRDY